MDQKTRSFPAQTRFARKTQVLKQHSNDTLVLFNMDDGKYYALDEIGGRVWDLCDGQVSVEDIVNRIHFEYEAPLEVIQDDIVTLLDDLLNENLLAKAG